MFYLCLPKKRKLIVLDDYWAVCQCVLFSLAVWVGHQLLENFWHLLIKTDVCELCRHACPRERREQLHVAVQGPLEDLSLHNPVAQVPELTLVAVEAQANALTFQEERVGPHVGACVNPREHSLAVAPPGNCVPALKVSKSVCSRRRRKKLIKSNERTNKQISS